jgi:hypothetical protein
LANSGCVDCAGHVGYRGQAYLVLIPFDTLWSCPLWVLIA